MRSLISQKGKPGGNECFASAAKIRCQSPLCEVRVRWRRVLGLICLALNLASAPLNQRDVAIRRGLHFIYTTATDPGNFKEYGGDYLWCFYGIASTSSDHELSRMAQSMGRERARQWRAEHPSVPKDASADEIQSLVFASYAADGLGVRDERMKRELIRAAGRYRPEDYLGFDPQKEPPPGDIPEQCGRCGKYNRRGVRVCERCGSHLTMRSPYDVLEDAVITVYSGDRYGVRLGGRLEDVTQWLVKMRPYRGDVAYAVTHIVYALNGYSRFRLRPEWLPDEFAFLRANLMETIAEDDPETTGEFLDTLKSFGLSDADPLIRSGIAFTLSQQNPDGSWGDPKAGDVYERYHPTWTAIDGLRDYAWHGEGVTSKEALRRAQGHPAR